MQSFTGRYARRCMTFMRHRSSRHHSTNTSTTADRALLNDLSKHLFQNTDDSFVHSQLVYDPKLRWKGTSAKKQAGVLIPLCHVDNALHVLFTERSSNLNTHSGEISFPGGIKDPEDATLMDTCRRETLEEIGIGQVDIFGYHYTVPDKTLTIAVTPYVGYIGRITLSDIAFNPSEVANVFSIPLKHFMDPENKRYMVLRHSLRIPEWHVFPTHSTLPVNRTLRIWGLTAMMLDNAIQHAFNPVFTKN